MHKCRQTMHSQMHSQMHRHCQWCMMCLYNAYRWGSVHGWREVFPQYTHMCAGVAHYAVAHMHTCTLATYIVQQQQQQQQQQQHRYGRWSCILAMSYWGLHMHCWDWLLPGVRVWGRSTLPHNDKNKSTGGLCACSTCARALHSCRCSTRQRVSPWRCSN